jgi:hypothetical protein
MKTIQFLPFIIISFCLINCSPDKNCDGIYAQSMETAKSTLENKEKSILNNDDLSDWQKAIQLSIANGNYDSDKFNAEKALRCCLHPEDCNQS